MRSNQMLTQEFLKPSKIFRILNAVLISTQTTVVAEEYFCTSIFLTTVFNLSRKHRREEESRSLPLHSHPPSVRWIFHGAYDLHHTSPAFH